MRIQNAEAVVSAWYRDHLADTLSRSSADAISHVEAAIADLKKRLEDGEVAAAHAIEAWFAERMKKPPVSHDTALYNVVHAAVQDLHGRLGLTSPDQAAPAVAPPPAPRTDRAPTADPGP